MAGCCGGNTCQCKVEGEGSVDVTGDGSLNDPYVVTLKYLTEEETLNFGSINAGLQASLTVSVMGALVGDVVMVGAPSTLEAGLSFCAYVSAADTVRVIVTNNTAGSIDPASASWKIGVLK